MANTPQTTLSLAEFNSIAVGDEFLHDGHWLPIYEVEHRELTGDRIVVEFKCGRPTYSIGKVYVWSHGCCCIPHDRFRKAAPAVSPFIRPMAGDALDRMMATAERMGALKHHLDTLISAIDLIQAGGFQAMSIAKADAHRARALLDMLAREQDEARAQRVLADLPDRGNA